jgi:hypothetical protein
MDRSLSTTLTFEKVNIWFSSGSFFMDGPHGVKAETHSQFYPVFTSNITVEGKLYTVRLFAKENMGKPVVYRAIKHFESGKS